VLSSWYGSDVVPDQLQESPGAQVVLLVVAPVVSLPGPSTLPDPQPLATAVVSASDIAWAFVMVSLLPFI
jgi:hypothetical protein